MTRQLITTLFLTALSLSFAQADTIIPGGYVSGTWTAAGSPYLVQGDITVHDDSTLNIDPGVEVEFQGNYSMTVNGYLEAVGTEADSIHFAPVTTWSGLQFSNAPDSSHLAYCTVSGVNDLGAVICSSSNPVITHSTISNNQGSFWGGINLESSHPTISYCTISNNTHSGYGDGGGIRMGGSNPQISHCDIFGNSISSGGYGAGVSIGDGNPSLDHCTISDNYTNAFGGGIAILGSGQVTITDCIINADSALSWGGGIYVSSSAASVTINNSTISNCLGYSGGGAYIYQAATVSMTDCAFESNVAHSTSGNGSAISIAFAGTVSLMSSTLDGNSCWGGDPGGGVIYSANCDNLILNHCNVVNNDAPTSEEGGIFLYGNTALTVINSIFRNQTTSHILFQSYSSASITYSDFYESNPPFIGGPPGLGVIDTVNANGDPCDTFCNIYMDPLFVNFAGGDYHLTAGSPCIDAGDPASPLDPDSTITDMGRYYFDQGSPVIGRDRNEEIPTIFHLCPPYPNPFNPATTFKMELPSASWLTLEIFDVGGRSIGFIVDGWRSAGYHEVTFDATGLASGVYVYRLEAGDFNASGKMVLLK